MAQSSLFRLPDEVILSSICAQYPCRELQIRTLSTLLSSYLTPPNNIVLYGLRATGKTVITKSLLSAICSAENSLDDDNQAFNHTLKFAIVRTKQCVNARHLLETTVAAVADAVGWSGSIGKCETVAQLTVELSKLLNTANGSSPWITSQGTERRFVLVFDEIDRLRDIAGTLLPGLARSGELIPELTVMFIISHPRPHFLRTSSIIYLNFPAYRKDEALRIMSLDVPSISSPAEAWQDPKTDRETAELYSRFVSVLWDSLSKYAGRDILSLRDVSRRLWYPFTSLVRDGTYTRRDFTRMLVAKRPLFQDEALLVPSITSSRLTTSNTPNPNSILKANPNLQNQTKPRLAITAQLPTTQRLLLISAYLASYIPARLDLTLFSKSSTFAKKRRKKYTPSASKTQTISTNSETGLKTRHRKIPRMLLGPQAFNLERLLAIFAAIRSESNASTKYLKKVGGEADVQMGIATLVSLRLLIRAGAHGDPLEAGSKYRANISGEIVRGLGRSVGVEVEDFMVE